MTESPRAAATPAAKADSLPARWLVPGLGGLAAGGLLTILAVRWSQGMLGLLGLVLVLGSLFWLGLGLMRRLARRYPRA